MEPKPDPLRELLFRYRCGDDEAAFTELVQRTRPRLLSIARRIAGAEQAEDCVQAAYYSLLRKERYPEEAPVSAWLVTSVLRIAYREKATRKRQTDIARALGLGGKGIERTTPSGDAARSEEAELVRSAVESLPGVYRDALVLFYLQGLTSREVAELLDVPEATVRTHLRRGRHLLRSRLPGAVCSLLVVLPWRLADAAQASTACLIAALAQGGLMKAKLLATLALTFMLIPAGLVWWSAQSTEEETARVAVQENAEPAAVGPVIVDRPEESAATGAGGENGAPAVAAALVARPQQGVDAILGIVVDGSGTPMAGVEVYVDRGQYARGSKRGRSKGATAAPRPPRAVTAADGSFRIGEVTAAEVRLGARFLGYRLQEWQEDEAGASRSVPVIAHPGDHTLRLRMRDCGLIAGVVRDLAGKPVPGARVALTAGVGALGSLPGAHVQGQTSQSVGADGTFAFECPAGGKTVLRAFEPSTGSGEVMVSMIAGTRVDDVDIVLAPGAILSGVVTDDAAAPVVGAELSLRRVVPAGAGRPYASWPAATTRSDREGRFTIAGLDPGRYELRARRDYQAEAIELTVTAPDRGLQLLLVRDITLQGRVLDPTGTPLGGAKVRATIAGGGRKITHRNVQTGRDGRFDMRAIPPGELELHGCDDDFLASEAFRRRVSPGDQITGIDLRTRDGATLRGRVVDGQGAGVAGVEVQARILDREAKARAGIPDSGPQHGVSAEDGSFEIRGLLADTLYVLAYWKQGLVALTRPAIFAAGSDALLEVGTGATVRGRVVDAGGAPVEGASVRATLRRFSEVALTRNRGALSQTDGSFELTGLPPWHCRLTCKNVDGATAAEPVELELGIAQVVTGIELLVGPQGDPACGIEGRVVAADGSPMSRVKITARVPGSATMRDAVTDEAGGFALLGLPRGDLEVEAALAGHSQRGGPIHAHCGARLSIEMIGLGSLAGRVLDTRGLPVQDFEVRALVPAPGETGGMAMSTKLHWMPFRSSAGAFRYALTGDSEPVIGLLVRAEGVSLASKGLPPVDVHAETDIGNVVLSRPGVIHGRVVDTAGLGLAGVRLTIRQQAEWGSPERRATTTDTGSFELDAALTGPGEILALHPDWIEERIAVMVSEEELLGVQVTLHSGAVLQGFVSDERGRPVPGACVLVTTLGAGAGTSPERRVFSGHDGRYRVAGLRLGDHLARARHADSPRYGEEHVVAIDAIGVLSQDLEVPPSR